MKKRRCFSRIFPALLGMLMLLTACGEDEYHYPSVRLEFLTAFSGTDGKLKSVLTDEGVSLPVAEDASNLTIDANSFIRIISNYAPMTAADGSEGVKLYAVASTISSMPQPPSKFEQGVKNDPVELQSIWMGIDYLNMVLGIKVQNGTHRLGFVEDEVSKDTESGHTTVRLSLYHDSSNDVQAYTKRAYVSVPLWQYATEGVQQVSLYFTLHTSSGEETYSFEYVPNSY